MANVIEIIFKGTNAVGGAIKGITSGIKKVTGAIFNMQNALVALAGVAAFTKIIKASAELESSLANVSTLVDTTKVSMDDLKKGVLALSSSVNKMPVELVEGLYQTISAGAKPGKESLLILESSAKLATAGLTTTASAVDIMTTAINAYGLEASDATKISDILFKTVEQGKTTVGALAQNLGLAIPTAAALSISLEELTAGVATLTKGGFSTDIAITSLNSAFNALLTNADKFKKQGVDIIKVAGEEGMTGVFRKVKELTNGNVEALQALIPEQRALKAVLSLTGKQYDEYNKILNKVENSTGSTQIAFEKQMETFNELFKALKIEVTKTMIVVGDAFTPVTKDLLKDLTAAVPNIQKFILTAGILFGKLPEILTIVTISLKKVLKSFFTDFSVFQAFSDNFLKLGEVVVNNFILIVKELADIVLKASFIIWAPLAASFRVIGSNIKRIWEITFQGLVITATDGLLAIVSAANRILPKAFELDTTGLENFRNAALDSTVGPALTMEQAWADSGTVISDLFSTMGQDFTDLGFIFEAGTEQVKEQFLGLAESEELLALKTQLGSLFDEAQNEAVTFGIMATTVGETSGLLADEIGAGITKVTATTNSALGQTQTKAVSFMALFKAEWKLLQKDIKTGWQKVAEFSAAIMNSAFASMGDGIASVIVDGENLGNVLKDVFKGVAKSIISALVQMGIQWLVTRAITGGVIQSETAQRMASLSAQTFAGAFAATAAIPIIGPAIAPGVAIAATAGMQAGAAASGASGAALGAAIGAPALAEGGIVTEPTLALIGEAGPEAVIPLSKGGLGGSVTIENIELFPNVTAGEAILSIPRDVLETWILREFKPVLENLARSGQLANIGA